MKPFGIICLIFGLANLLWFAFVRQDMPMLAVGIANMELANLMMRDK